MDTSPVEVNQSLRPDQAPTSSPCGIDDPGNSRRQDLPLLEPPALVSALAAKVGGVPWLWTVAADHVSIIMITGQKYRFDRAQ
jgi:hypothetical protein